MNHCTLRRLPAALILLILGLAVASPLSVAAQDDDGRFGVIESYDDPAAATRLGAAWTRVRFQWADVQPDGPDEWQPPLEDDALAAELEAGRLVTGLLIGIPDWARARDRLPEGLYLSPDDPDNTWAVFVREAVSRHEGQIDNWIIWNEPDIADADAPGHTWDGDAADFAQLLRVAYLVAKEANPDAVIHLGAFTYFWDPDYFGRFLDILLSDPEAADHNYYFDVATAHLYFQPGAIYDVLGAFRADMTTRGLSKPIWLVETNAPPADDPYWLVPNWTLYVTVYEQAAFIPQALASALAAGAERVAVFKLMDVEGDRAANPEPFGLLRQDSSRRPAYDSYRVAIRQLAGVETAVRQRWDAVGQIRLDQGDQTTTVLFTRLPFEQEAKVLATSETAELVDMWGKARTVTADNGVYRVMLPPALCIQTIGDYCMIGGTVYYLVQAVDERPSGALPPDNVTATPRAATATATPTTAATPVAMTETAVATTATTVKPAITLSPPTPQPGTAEVASPAPVAVVLATVTPRSAPTAESGAVTRSDDSGGAPVNGLLLIGAGLVGALALGGWVLHGRRSR